VDRTMIVSLIASTHRRRALRKNHLLTHVRNYTETDTEGSLIAGFLVRSGFGFYREDTQPSDEALTRALTCKSQGPGIFSIAIEREIESYAPHWNPGSFARRPKIRGPTPATAKLLRLLSENRVAACRRITAI
jgi:hypothetical protein